MNAKENLFARVEVPKPQWELTFNGDRDLVFHLPTAPNRFYRWTQKIILGFHWNRVGSSNKETTHE